LLASFTLLCRLECVIGPLGSLLRCRESGGRMTDGYGCSSGSLDARLVRSAAVMRSVWLLALDAMRAERTPPLPIVRRLRVVTVDPGLRTCTHASDTHKSTRSAHSRTGTRWDTPPAMRPTSRGRICSCSVDAKCGGEEQCSSVYCMQSGGRLLGLHAAPLSGNRSHMLRLLQGAE
jgi:hypothetical protein